jgi:hypothetical protein
MGAALEQAHAEMGLEARDLMADCVFQGIVDARFRRSWTAFQMSVDAVSG